MSGSLHDRLRQASAGAHRRLEAALGLLDGPPSRARFESLVAAFRGFHAAWEPALGAVLADETLLAPRRRLPLIDADLATFGWDAPRIRALPACTAAAGLCDDAARAAGSLYVLEGSTLGGQVIARHVAGAPWCPPGGLRTFDPYGAEVGRRWRETLGWLAALPPARWPRVLDGCLETFELLLHWLPHHPAPHPSDFTAHPA